MKRNIAVWDVESTGIDTSTDRIVQIAILIIDSDLNIVHPLVSSLINPQMPISPEAQEVHGISAEMVKDAPTFEQVAVGIHEGIKDCDLCFYNGIKFDLPMLIEEFARAGINFDYSDKKLLDLYLVFSKKEKRGLAEALKFYAGKEILNAHDAGADVMATYEVLKGQLSKYEDVTTLEHIDAFGEPENRCDLARRFYKEDGVIKFNFGKHYGKAAMNEPSYLDYMLREPFPIDTKNFINRHLKK